MLRTVGMGSQMGAESKLGGLDNLECKVPFNYGNSVVKLCLPGGIES